MKNIQYLILFVVAFAVACSLTFAFKFAFDSSDSELLPSKSKNVLREYTLIDSNADEVDVIIFEDDGKKFMLTRGHSSMGLVQIVE